MLIALIITSQVNSQIFKYYGSPSPFSFDSFDLTVLSAIKTNKLRPSTNYWETTHQRESTTPINYERYTKDSKRRQRPKLYPPPIANHNPSLSNARLRPSHQVVEGPVESLVSTYRTFGGHQNADYDPYSIPKYRNTPNMKLIRAEYQLNNHPFFQSNPQVEEHYKVRKAPSSASKDYDKEINYFDGNYNVTETYCNPEAQPACYNYQFGMCVEDNSYPQDDIRVTTFYLCC